jgi:thiol:disulfide interchange protein
MSLTEALWHGLGVISLICLAVLARYIIQEARREKFRRVALSIGIGSVLGMIALALATTLYMALAENIRWIAELPFPLDAHLLTSLFILSAFAGGKAGAFALRKHASPGLIVHSALMAAFLVTLHSVGIGWLV